MDILDKKLDETLLKINLIQKTLDKMSNETERMDNHISFVEAIYEQIKKPFHFLINISQKLIDSRKKFLPLL